MIRAPTWAINPMITRENLQDEFDRAPAFIMMEYGAEFADVVNALFTEKQIMQCVDLVLDMDFRHPWVVALDPGLTGASYALATGYKIEDKVVVG